MILCLFLLSLAFGQGSARSHHLVCGACRILADEVEYAISRVNPRKKLQVGSYRLDDAGNQKPHEVPYARSELHLGEVLETVCDDNMGQYAESQYKNGSRCFVRMYARSPSERIALTNVLLDTNVQEAIKYECVSFLADFEEEALAAFRAGPEDLEKRVCVDIDARCSRQELSDYRVIAATEEVEHLFKPPDISKAAYTLTSEEAASMGSSQAASMGSTHRGSTGHRKGGPNNFNIEL